MKLNKLELESRPFLIQFDEISKEFGNHIPWFNKIKKLKYITDVKEFKLAILQTLWLDLATKINPYILTTGTKGQEYVWSVLNFSSSPERFVDPNNELIRQQLESEKYAYLSCLQIRDIFKTDKPWMELLSKSLHEILKEFHRVRCVVQDPKLLSYYTYFGAELVNNTRNKDWLYIMSWDEKSFTKRH